MIRIPRFPLFVACLVPALLLPTLASARSPSTAERLELLERRVARVTQLTLQMDELREENRQLRGQIEDLGYQIEQLKRRQRDIYQDIDQRLGSSDAAVAPSADSSESAPRIGPPLVSKPASGGDRKHIVAEYDKAYALLSPQQKRYDEAARAFAAFVEKYPQDPLTSNAQYWLGEAYYVSQHNQKALQAFERVVSQHPNSSKVPGALFKIGRLQQAAGKQDAARASYQRVVKEYPSSAAAGLARQKLKQLDG